MKKQDGSKRVLKDLAVELIVVCGMNSRSIRRFGDVYRAHICGPRLLKFRCCYAGKRVWLPKPLEEVRWKTMAITLISGQRLGD